VQQRGQHRMSVLPLHRLALVGRPAAWFHLDCYWNRHLLKVRCGLHRAPPCGSGIRKLQVTRPLRLLRAGNSSYCCNSLLFHGCD